LLDELQGDFSACAAPSHKAGFSRAQMPKTPRFADAEAFIGTEAFRPGRMVALSSPVAQCRAAARQ